MSIKTSDTVVGKADPPVSPKPASAMSTSLVTLASAILVLLAALGTASFVAGTQGEANVGSKNAWDSLTSKLQIHSFDQGKHNLGPALRAVFDDWQGELSDLHDFFPETSQWKLRTLDNDTKTLYHKHYYDSPHYEALHQEYLEFVRTEVLPLFDASETGFAVQRDPSFRVHLPQLSNLGIRPGHGDANSTIGIHCDSEYKHPSEEVNFILPFTPMFDTNSLWIESGEGAGDFAPINMGPGNLASFYGNKWRHFNKINTSGQTRVSWDFRIVPMSKYVHRPHRTSLHSTRTFSVDEGGYYVYMTREGGVTPPPAFPLQE